MRSKATMESSVTIDDVLEFLSDSNTPSHLHALAPATTPPQPNHALAQTQTLDTHNYTPTNHPTNTIANAPNCATENLRNQTPADSKSVSLAHARNQLDAYSCAPIDALPETNQRIATTDQSLHTDVAIVPNVGSWTAHTASTSRTAQPAVVAETLHLDVGLATGASIPAEQSAASESAPEIGSTLQVVDASGKRKFVCSWRNCGRAFSTKWGLGRHERIHTGNMPWICHFAGCGKGFVDRTLLLRHLRTHSIVRPHVCRFPNCGKSFKVAKHLEYHEKLHDQPNLFSCDVPGCNKTFANPASLRMHSILRHGDPDLETAEVKQLRAQLQDLCNGTRRARQDRTDAQSKLKAVNSNLKQLRKISIHYKEVFSALMRENEMLKDALSCLKVDVTMSASEGGINFPSTLMGAAVFGPSEELSRLLSSARNEPPQ